MRNDDGMVRNAGKVGKTENLLMMNYGTHETNGTYGTMAEISMYLQEIIDDERQKQHELISKW